ncbi:MAG: SH3 domain-containing protein [Anaerolineae bacterium]|nr:SH3 domain-containing protein [Anaerolineae bacterium]
MRKVWLFGGIILLLSIITFFIFTLLFTQFFVITSNTPPPATPTPQPTFTSSPTATVLVIASEPTATSTPLDTPVPTVTATSVDPTATATSLSPTATPTSAAPQVVADSTVNVRSGPGLNYPVIGALPPNTAVPAVGRTADQSWWQLQLPEGQTGWVAASVVDARNTAGLPVAQAPAPPEPTATPPPPEPTRSPYQFEPTGWYSDRNLGLTRFLGNITDANGTPVNGVPVQAACGGFSVISNPSGPVGGWSSNDGADDPPGFYDITIARYPVVCKWTLSVVYTEDGVNVLQRLSEPVEIDVTTEESIVTANWRKNW